jgi:cellulose biosynthesis protein BcsQ
MIPLVVYAESGGTFKTTYAANLSVAFSRLGLDVLTLDFDAQSANLTRLFGANEKSDDPDADNIARHILEQPKGEFEDLIVETGEGFDLIPAHGMLSNFESNLTRKKQRAVNQQGISPDKFPEDQLLHRLLWEREKVHEEYDVVLIDPNARAEKLLYNALYALRSVICPIRPSGKGSISVEGLALITKRMEEHHDITIGLAALAPTAVGRTKTHQRVIERLRETNPVPVTIGKREALMDEMWDAPGTAFRVVEERFDKPSGEHESQPEKRRMQDREVETLCKLLKLAGTVATETYDMDIDPVVEFEITGKDNYEYDIRKEPDEFTVVDSTSATKETQTTLEKDPAADADQEVES